MASETVIGIDLGTTYSVVATIDDAGRPVVLQNGEGENTTPSAVYVGDGEPEVGMLAKRYYALGEEGAFAFFKRVMGDSSVVFPAAGRDWTPTDLSALVLARLKADAENALGKPVTKAVVTVPAYFNELQRRATEAAGRQAGLEVLQTINEPTAAAIAYGLGGNAISGRILVYDLGGGTFDVTILDVSETELKVIATDGDHELGGKDWDDRIANWIASRFRDEHGVDPLDDAEAACELLVQAENVKRRLSARTRDKVAFSHGGHRFSAELTRTEFEELSEELVERTGHLCDVVFDDAGLEWSQIDGVLLVGGSTRMPMIREYVARTSGREPLTGVNVDEVVALGAAIRGAAKLAENGPRLSLPPGRSVPEVTDVMSHTLGMIAESETGDAYVNSMILAKNQPVPCTHTRPYQLPTQAAGPNELEVYVTQGESTIPQECTVIGRYRCADVSHGESGLQVLDVSYSYDDSGMVRIAAIERATRRELAVVRDDDTGDLSWLDLPPRRTTAAGGHVTAYLAFDLSGSMAGRPIEEAKRMAHEFVDQSDLTKCRIGLIEFADVTRTAVEASRSARDVGRAIDAMRIGSEHAGCVGYGNGAHPFDHAGELLRDVAGPRFVIVLADGIWSYEDRAVAAAKQCHAEGIEIVALGFGAANEQFLKQIATTETSAFFAASPAELVPVFGSIAREIVETGGRSGALKLAGRS